MSNSEVLKYAGEIRNDSFRKRCYRLYRMRYRRNKITFKKIGDT